MGVGSEPFVFLLPRLNFVRVDKLVCAFEGIFILYSNLRDDIQQLLPLPVALASVLELDELFPLPQPVELFLSGGFLGSGRHHEDRIFDEVLLDEVVERGVGGKAGRVVDLQQKHPFLVVHHEIEPQELETPVRPRLLRPAQPIVVHNLRLRCQQGLHNAVLDLRPVGVGPEPHFFEALEELGERFFVAAGEVVGGVVVLVVGVRLVDRVVGEVHVEVVEVVLRWQLVGLSRESHQTLVVEIDPHRLHARQ